MTVELLHRVTHASEEFCVRNLSCLAPPARVNSNDGHCTYVFDGFDVLQGMVASVS